MDKKIFIQCIYEMLKAFVNNEDSVDFELTNGEMAEILEDVAMKFRYEYI